MIPKIATVVPAAGVGKRMNADRPKQYLELAGATVLEQTVKRLQQVPALDDFFIAVSEDDPYFEHLTFLQQTAISRVPGGQERANSVLNALSFIDAEHYPWTLVHDAARPVVRVADIEALISRCLAQNCGGILATPVRDTMKRGGQSVEHTVNRHQLWHAYTPQLFPTNELKLALSKALDAGVSITDEASAIEWAQGQVLLVQGHADNIKITQAEDLALARFYLEHQ